MANVLIVDDDVDITRLQQITLQRAGYEVLTAESGEAALKLLDANSVDVVILDLVMPGIGGEETLRRLKQKHPLVEVIVLTGHAGKDSVLAAFREGAADVMDKTELGFTYLQKPMPQHAVKEQVSAAVRRRRQSRTINVQTQEGVVKDTAHFTRAVRDKVEENLANLTAGDFIMDVAAKAVYFQGKLIELSAAKAAVFKLFMMKPTSLHTYRAIAKNVYGERLTKAEANAKLKSFMYYFRQDLEELCGYEVIESRGQAGFKFNYKAPH